MRIIAGSLGGRVLLGPPSDTTRPITDRAKQALFDALSAAISLPGIRVLDCFCGTGSMGLECLSRGAASATLIERDRGALDALRKNIAAFGVEPVCTVLPVDAYRLRPETISGTPFDLLFIDPPYAHMASGHQRGQVDALMAGLARGGATEGALMIVRHPTGVSVDANALGVSIEREMRFGDMAITWLSVPRPAQP